MKELYDEICKDEKEMEDLIFDCIEVFFHSIYFIVQFYDVELPELETYRQSLKEIRATVFSFYFELIFIVTTSVVQITKESLIKTSSI